MRQRFADESGAIAVIVAVSLTFIFVLAALVVDVGYWYDTRHQLQAAADAAALAGCEVLIETQDPGAAEAAARDYAARNANGAGTGLLVDDVAVNKGAEPWSVTVDVHRAVQGMFTGVIGKGAGRSIHADAKAVKTPLTGARYVMPWGLPVIKDADVDRVEAVLVNSGGSVVSGPVVLSGAGARRWSGSINAPSSAGGYDLRVVVYNIYGVAEWVGDSKGVQPASRVMVDSAGYPFQSITVIDDYEPSDGSPAITVSVKTKKSESDVRLGVGKTKVKMNGSGTSWSYVLTGAEIDFDNGFLNTYPIDVHIGSKADGLVDAYAHVRRSTYPFDSVTSAPGVVSGGASVSVDVMLSAFDPTSLVPGQIYTIRVGSDGVETGNFGELNFGNLEHNTGYNPGPCPPDPAGVDLGNNVKDWVESGYGGGIHIGDILPVSPGKSGWTSKVVADRIDKYGDIVVVPVVAKYEPKSGGSYDVIVREFAAMRIVDFGASGGSKGTVEAEFLEYVATPSSFGTPGSGSGGSTAFAARLVNP